jgi:S1-C subfamily serine protease
MRRIHIVCLCLGAFLSLNLGAADFSEDVVNTAMASTFRVEAVGHGLGTGFAINNDGHVVTNYHVVEGANKFLVMFVKGRLAVVTDAVLVAKRPEKDLAILRCNFPFKVTAFPLVSRAATGGQVVMSIGFPGAIDDQFKDSWKSGLTATGKKNEFSLNEEALNYFTPATFAGSVGKEMTIDSGFGGDFRAIAHDAKISEGNSGGPLIDLDGRLVGVNVQGSRSRGLKIDYAYSIHASEVIDLCKSFSIPVTVANSRPSSAGSADSTQTLLIAAVVGLSLVTFLMVLRKPREALVDGISRLTRPGGKAHTPMPMPAPPRSGRMILRGRDLEGHSFKLEFDAETLRRSGGRLILGRKRDLCQLHLPHDSVSRQHAALVSKNGSLCLEDRNSGNGTILNGKTLTIGSPPVPLKSGDRIKLGEVELMFDIIV